MGLVYRKQHSKGLVAWLCEEVEGGGPSPSSSMVAIMQKPIEALPGSMQMPPATPEPPLSHLCTSRACPLIQWVGGGGIKW